MGETRAREAVRGARQVQRERERVEQADDDVVLEAWRAEGQGRRPGGEEGVDKVVFRVLGLGF